MFEITALWLIYMYMAPSHDAKRVEKHRAHLKLEQLPDSRRQPKTAKTYVDRQVNMRRYSKSRARYVH
jgi:hypothetical protein